MKVMVLGAGGPAGVNTCRALVAAGHEVLADDLQADHLVWCDEVGAQTVGYSDDFDVLVPQPDPLVRMFAGMQRTFLPPVETIDICQDKQQAVDRWFDAGLRGPAITVEEPYPDMLHLAALELGRPFWLRASRGAGAHRAIKVEQIGEAYHWIRFWESRGEQIQWIAEPYLPGRDLAWSSIWYHGELVACFLRERLEYLYPNLTPEGLTGTPTISRIVHDDDVAFGASASVTAIDESPHGIFSVDLREDHGGVARPTEINAGRGFTTMGLWSLYDVNFCHIAARCVVEAPGESYIDPLPEGLTLSRHIDCGHVFTRETVFA